MKIKKLEDWISRILKKGKVVEPELLPTEKVKLKKKDEMQKM